MRKLCLFGAGFALAAAGCVYLRWNGPMLAMAAAALAASFLFRWRGPRRVSVLLLGLCAGILWCFLYEALLLAPAQKIENTHAQRTAVVTGQPRATDYGASVEVDVLLEGRRFGALLYGDETLLTLTAGDQVSGPMEAQPAGRSLALGERLYLRSCGLVLVLYADGPLAVTEGTPPLFARLRLFLQHRIDSLFSGEIAAFLRALLTGDTSQFSYSTDNDLAVAGLSHTVAVSGMHVAILVSLVQLLTFSSPRLTALLGIPLVAVFTLVTGASPSACRAAVMELLLLGAPLLRREYDRPTALGAAALVLLAQNPWAIANVSFQLSFAAVAGLTLFAMPIQQRLECRLPRFIAAALAATLSATLFTLPLTLFYFSLLSLVAPLSNLLCLWAVTGALCLGLFAAVLPPLGPILAIPAAWLSRYVLTVAGLLARFPYAAAYVYNPALLVVGAAALCLGVGVLCFRRRLRWLSAAMLAAFVAAAFVGRFNLSGAQVRVLDVGQGQAILLEVDGFTAVIDCGGEAPEAAGEDMARLLHSAGITRIDALVLTHYDADHAGGAVQLLHRLNVDFAYLPVVEDETGIRAQIEAALEEAGARTVFVSGETTVTFSGGQLRLFPALSGGRNDGLAILASAGEYDMLVTGDLDMRQEQQLLLTYSLPQVELLLAGHHGAANSTSAALLQTVRPQLVAISVGADNRYGHPAAETLSRIATYGATVCRTDLSGTLRINLDDSTP